MSSVLIYTTQFCSFCYRAKDLLEQKRIDFEEIAIGQSIALKQEMIQLSGNYTVPQVFIDGTPIGGCNELYMLDYNGDLDKMLNKQPEN